MPSTSPPRSAPLAATARVEGEVRTTGALTGDPPETAYHLLLTDTGLWLSRDADGTRRPLRDARYIARALGADRLETAEGSLSISLGQKRAARELFARGRIRGASGPLAPIELEGRYLIIGSAVACDVVRAWLAPGETPLIAPRSILRLAP